ncbi:MAG: SDR family oxidoreductase [Rhodobacteraceae bacterium]|nr:SDR family oxidoreductase [Paracoccaceae bacterium]
MTKNLLIFGYGYTGQVFADLMRAEGWKVTGTTREAEKSAALQAAGHDVFHWPGTDIRPALAAATHVLISAGPNDVGDPVLAQLGKEFAGAKHLEWLGYLSTTGVYGDHNGSWVDETTALNPATKRGHQRVFAENQWLDLFKNHDLPLHIFRLAGIYGPDRGPFAKVRNGTARRIIKARQVFSRTHVDDIAQVLRASATAPDAGNIYNVCDNDPAPPQDVIAEAARLLNLPIPDSVDFETADMTPMARSFYAESKKVSNAKIKTKLGIKLIYPDYKTGLRALLATEQATYK